GRAGVLVRDPWLLRRLEDLGAGLGFVGRLPVLVRIDEPGSPALTGLRRPAILLPAPLLQACDTRELQLVLAHELAHLKRRDLLWGWLPAAAHALFWFHPAVWLANHEWYAAQEMACDALAVQATAARTGEYERLMLKVAAA